MAVSAVKGCNFLRTSDTAIDKMAEKSKLLYEMNECEEVRESIKKIASKVFAGNSVQIHLFGSRVIGLATDESDLDIYIEIDGSFSSSSCPSNMLDIYSQDTRLTKLANALKCELDWTVKETILQTAVPIIVCEFQRFYSFSSQKMSCDINFTNGVSVRNSELIGHLFKLQPEAVKLFHFIREWLKVQDFKTVKGYTLTLLLIFFLQSKYLMPKVRDLQLGESRETIDGYDVHFNRYTSLSSLGITKMIDFKEHVQDFFNFYSSFDFSRVISTFDGEKYYAHTYRQKYPKFNLKGILIAGPCKRGSNCGTSVDRETFKSFVKQSKEFFDENVSTVLTNKRRRGQTRECYDTSESSSSSWNTQGTSNQAGDGEQVDNELNDAAESPRGANNVMGIEQNTLYQPQQQSGTQETATQARRQQVKDIQEIGLDIRCISSEDYADIKDPDDTDPLDGDKLFTIRPITYPEVIIGEDTAKIIKGVLKTLLQRMEYDDKHSRFEPRAGVIFAAYKEADISRKVIELVNNMQWAKKRVPPLKCFRHKVGGIMPHFSISSPDENIQLNDVIIRCLAARFPRYPSLDTQTWRHLVTLGAHYGVRLLVLGTFNTIKWIEANRFKFKLCASSGYTRLLVPKEVDQALKPDKFLLDVEDEKILDAIAGIAHQNY